MEFKQLEAFVAAVDYNSFSEAAKHLYLTQPTISAHVSTLEKELDSKLIIRTTKKMELTHRGQQLYECAVNILNLRDTIVQDFVGRQKKIIDLGASTIPASCILPEIMGKFRQEEPEVEYNLWQADSKEIISRVADGTLDFGLTGMTTDSPDCIFIPFCQDELVLATPANEYFSQLKAEQADLQTLLKEPFILRENGSGTLKEWNEFLRNQQVPVTDLKVIARMNDLESVKSSVVNGLGISILSVRSIQSLVEEGKLLTFSLGSRGCFRNLYIVYNKHRILKPYVSQMIQFIQACC